MMKVLFCGLFIAGGILAAEAVEPTSEGVVVYATSVTNDAKAVEALTVVDPKEAVEATAVAEAEEVAVMARENELEEAQNTPPDVDPWLAFEPPVDSKFDWLQLTSGEWLKGDFKVLYDYKLEFDSDELDLLKFDFEDVKQLRTRAMKTVFLEGEGGPRDTSVLRGMLVIKGDLVKLIRSEHEVSIPRDRVISIAGGKQRERDYWSGMVSLGVNARGGNTETTDTTVMANLKRRTAATRFNADYLANYSQSDAGGETANNQRVNGSYDRFLTARFFWQVLSGEYYRDPFTNNDGQYSVGMGVGYDLIHTPKTDWTTTFGFGYQQQQFVSVAVGKADRSSSPIGTFGTRFEHEVSGNLDFLYDYSMRFLNEGNGQYTHHMLTQFSFDVIHDLDLDVSFIWDRIEKPQPLVDTTVPQQDDYQLIVSLAYDF